MERYKKLYHVHRYNYYDPELEKSLLKDGGNLWYTIYRNMGWNKIEKYSRDGYIEYILNIPSQCFTSEVADNDRNKNKILVLTNENILNYNKFYPNTNPRTEGTKLRDNYAGVDAHGTWNDVLDKDQTFLQKESVDLVNKGSPSGVIWRFKGLYEMGMNVVRAHEEIPSEIKPSKEDHEHSMKLLYESNKDKYYLLSDGKRSKNKKRKKKIKFRGSIRKKTKKRSYKKKLSRSS